MAHNRNGRFAPVIPPKVILQYDPRDRLAIFGDYHLLLAHDVIANPALYQEAYAEILQSPTRTIIMDNSLIELGYPLDPVALAAACHHIPADYLVLPDYLGFMHKTLEASEKAVDALVKAGLTKVGFLGVVQGQNMGECITCACMLAQMENVKALSIPRHCHVTVGSRVGVVQMVAQMTKLPMHLLGFSDDLIDDIAAVRAHHLVMGIDSAVPIRTVNTGVEWKLPMERVPARPKDWWDHAHKEYGTGGIQRVEALCELEDNIRTVRRWLTHD